jgi:lipid II:glycine glycyltransferase (peptidoglycan interpeptide bridge formation enzyme)
VTSPTASTLLVVREIGADEHLAFVRRQRSVSFLQTPAWGAVKAEWRHESLGWFQGGELVGAGLVLYRQLPRVKRYLAYLPEGPAIDWEVEDLTAWLKPLAAHLKRRGAFGVRMGPPVVTRRWDAATVKAGIADSAVTRLGDLAPTERSHGGARVVAQLRDLGWRPMAVEGGFAAGQPQFVFQVPLAGRTEEQVLAGMNQLWRRNIKKAAKEGVEVTSYDGVAMLPELQTFHDLYVHTAERDHFTPRPLAYFQTMYDALGGDDPERITLWLAHHEADLVAATIAIRVGTHAWYSYGASSTDKRDVRGSNAVQWAMIRDAIDRGAEVYDLRGITDTLDPDDPHVGLIQFKAGTGGEAVETVGEWDLPLYRALYRGFDLYLRWRS